jgi:hypothetical protein
LLSPVITIAVEMTKFTISVIAKADHNVEQGQLNLGMVGS